jgi:hypothetical protein
MKTNGILFLILFSISSFAAKIPGYRGLRFSAQYQLGISPQWNNLTMSVMPYLTHNLQLGYVVSRKHEIGIQYSRIDYSSNVVMNFPNYSANSLVMIDQRDFTGNNVMVYAKFFRQRKGFIAPLGRYFLLGLSYQNSRDRFRVTQDDNSSLSSPHYTIAQSHDLALTVGVGRNFILFNRMLLTIEGDLNIPVSSGIRASLSRNDSSGLGTGIGKPDAFKYNNAVDVLLMNLVQIKIGLGALIF